MVLLLANRIFTIGLKYGIFSDEHMMMLRKLYLTDEVLDAYLVFNLTNNPDVNVHLENLDVVLESLKIDEKEFNLRVYKD